MIFAYRIFTNILYPFLFILLYVRVILKKEDPKRYKEKIFIKKKEKINNPKSSLIWFHAASIGEFKSIIPIIKEVNAKKANYEFLITTNTLSSGNLASSEIKRFNNVQHRFMPYDVEHLIEKFLKIWQPKHIILVDSEIWPNLILKAHQKKIPLALINARLTKKSFNRWNIFPKTAKKIFQKFDLCLCSNKESKKFLETLNAKNVRYEGNIKFIKRSEDWEFNEKNTETLINSRFWVAASIHKEEDIFCLNTHLELKKKFNDIVTIIAPRHIDRVNKIKLLCDNFKLKTQILNKEDIISKDKEIIIINSFGNLHNYFRHAKSVFIGKSMIKKLKNDGGQNPIDAVNLNCKIYHGHYVSNFEEVYSFLNDHKISQKISNYNELSKYLIEDLKYPQKKEQNIINPIPALGKKILNNTIILVENFLNDQNK